MAILKETTGDTEACDGCGRSQDAGANLGIETYTVQDPNTGSAARHHYCAGCAANRSLRRADGSAQTVQAVPGWNASPVAVAQGTVAETGETASA